MKKINAIQVDNQKIIKKEELKVIKGGYDGGVLYLCGCNGLPPQAWWGCYNDPESAAEELLRRCGSILGGGCSAGGAC